VGLETQSSTSRLRKNSLFSYDSTRY